MGSWQRRAEEGLAAPLQLQQNETLSRSPPIPDSCGRLVFTEDILLFKGDTFALLKWEFFLSPPCFQSPLYAIPIPRGHWSGDSLLFSQTKSIFCNIEFYAGIKKKKGKETPICGKKWSQHPCGVKWCIQHGWKGRSPVTVAAPPVEWELPPPVLWGQEEACPRPPASVRRPEMEEIARSYKMAIRGMTFKWQQCL